MESEELTRRVIARFERAEKVKPLAAAIKAASDWRARLNAIKAYYDFVQPEFALVKPWQWAYDPYEVDWPMLFTPIEAALWCDIRSLGVPFYPQYPVELHGGRVVYADFANPQRKIAIECDGKAFHANRERDSERDDAMGREGWKVFRFTGSECRSEEVERDILKIARCYLNDLPAEAYASQRLRSVVGFDK